MNLKKMLSIAVTMLLIASMLGAVTPVQADEVHIDIDGEGNFLIHVESGDEGDFSIIYNGRDILAELKSQYSRIASLKARIKVLKAQTDVADLQRELNVLVDELNMVLNDLFENLGFLIHIIGLNPGNSTIVQELLAGNATIVDYLGQVFERMNSTDVALVETYNELIAFEEYAQTQYATSDELTAFEEYTQTQLNATINELIALDAYWASRQDIWADKQLASEASLEATRNILYLVVAFSAVVILALAIAVKKLWTFSHSLAT